MCQPTFPVAHSAWTLDVPAFLSATQTDRLPSSSLSFPRAVDVRIVRVARDGWEQGFDRQGVYGVEVNRG